jgi:hypothetical protein
MTRHDTFDRRALSPDGMGGGSRMDIYDAAWGRPAYWDDPDAAAKFALAAIGRDARRMLGALANLVTANGPVGELEGDPGWTLERRDPGNEAPGYANWPEGAAYRAFVDPLQFRIGMPQQYYDRDSFHALVAHLLDALEQLHPDQAAAAAVRAKL